MTKKTYQVIFRYSPRDPWKDITVQAYSEEQAKLNLEMPRMDTTHNEIEFSSITKISL